MRIMTASTIPVRVDAPEPAHSARNLSVESAIRGQTRPPSDETRDCAVPLRQTARRRVNKRPTSSVSYRWPLLASHWRCCSSISASRFALALANAAPSGSFVIIAVYRET